MHASLSLKVIGMLCNKAQVHEACAAQVGFLRVLGDDHVEAAPRAMLHFSMGMERLFNAKHSKCRPLPGSCFKHYTREVRTSYLPERTTRMQFYLCSIL